MVAAIGLGVSLLVLQLLIDDRPLVAAATALLGLGAALTAYKVNRIAVTSARLLKEQRHSGAGGRGRFAQSGGSERAGAGWSRRGRTPGPGIAERPVPGGAIEPSVVQALDGVKKGRNAAAVTEDESRPHKLFAATQSGRRIAGIMSPEIAAALQTRYTVTCLRPDVGPAQLEQAQPSAIVLDERALDHGLWFGALRAGGGSLFRQVQAILDWATARQQTVYVLPDGTPRPYTGVLREQATFLVRPGLTAATDPDVELPLLESLLALVSGGGRRIQPVPSGGPGAS
jgi:hypothetical protein